MTLEEFIKHISQLDPLWAYLTIGGVAFVENIFPPLPSDVVVVAAGSLIGLGRIDYWISLLVASIGSTVGFLVMYKVGFWFGARILESGRITFLPLDQVHRVEGWFRKYGAWIVVVNRFMSGTRAVLSFFVGMSRVPIGVTAAMAFLSSLAWYSLLLFGGMELGENWRGIAVYLDAYGEAMTVIVVLVVGIVLIVRGMRSPRAVAAEGKTEEVNE
jgi:membrane protein DedA with SNARE-associated domain